MQKMAPWVSLNHSHTHGEGRSSLYVSLTDRLNKVHQWNQNTGSDVDHFFQVSLG